MAGPIEIMIVAASRGAMLEAWRTWLKPLLRAREERRNARRSGATNYRSGTVEQAPRGDEARPLSARQKT